jgi:protease PrsW
MIALIIAVIPSIIIAFYIYFRDKYEKEPIGLLLKGLFYGTIIIIPVIAIEHFFGLFTIYFFGLYKTFYDSFIIAGFTEEGIKYLAVILLIWKNENFNEKFDGIVYAVFVSIGFATVENLLYVFSQDALQTGLLRAFTAVPFHAINGVIMGFYLGMAKFQTSRNRFYLMLALLLPVLFHGFYDFCIMSGKPLGLLIWLPFLISLWILGFRKMKKSSQESVFKPGN